MALSLSAGVGIVAMLGLFLGAGIFLMIWRRGKKTTEIAAEKTAVETPDADSTVTYDAPGELALQKIDPPKPVNIKVVQKKIKIIQRTVNDEQNQD